MLDSLLAGMDTSLLLLTVIAALSLYWLWTKARRPYMKYKNLPPFPVPPRPFVGHLLILRRQNLRHLLKDWREKSGDIFAMDLGGRLSITISGYDIVREILVKHADKMPDVPTSFREKIFKGRNKGILGAGGDNWKEQRTVSLHILRSFGLGKNLLAEKIEEEVAVYTAKLASFEGKPVDVKTLTNISVSNVICSVIIGERFEYDDPYFVQFMGYMNDAVRLGAGVGLVTLLPFLYYLPGDFFNIKRWANSVQQTNELFSKAYINKIKKTFNEHEEPTNFIAAYLKELKKKTDNGESTLMDEENLVAIIRNLFIAGTETTSTTILWCLLFMLYNPDVQEKVYEEITTHVGTERSPNMHDKQKLLYLNAVILESQRLASLVPLGIRRVVREPFTFNGYYFPEGAMVVPNLDSVLHDKEVWGDPEKFRPERFLEQDGSLKHPDEMIPFSIGRRSCLGEALAKMELFLFLSSMFQRFKFEPAQKSGPLPTTEEIIGITCMPQPYELRFVNRT